MPQTAVNAEPLRVLIVEDETIVGMGHRAQLVKLGHNVIGQAANATEARMFYRDKQPDLVLMDIRLGDADGLELAEEFIKERRCPIIVLSAFSDRDLIQRAGTSGVFGYLVKPVGLESLNAQIEVSLQRFRDQELLRMEKEHLAQTLETRKLVEKAKGIFMKRLSLDESEAHKRLQAESQKRRMTLGELCKKVLESEEILGGS